MICKLVYFSPSLSRNHRQQLHSNFSIISSLSPSSGQCGLTKQGLRFLSTLSVKSDDNPAASKLIGKFVASSPKTIALNALSHLLSPDTTHPHLALYSLPLYLKIKEASWFEYSPKLVASLAALLDKQGNRGESEKLISDAVSRLENRRRELAEFHCSLVESHAKHGSSRGFDCSSAAVRGLVRASSSGHVKRRAFEALIGGLCNLGRPAEAEALMDEIQAEDRRPRPNVFEFRSIVYGYGRLGMLEDMVRVVGRMEKEGFEVDTVCSNMVLSSFGAHEDLPRMLTWLRRMRSSGLEFSVRTYNSVLNQCPGVSSVLRNLENAPVSVDELLGSGLEGDEALVVRELVGSGVLEGAMTWGPSEAKLDLHGMHLGTAYLIMMEWMDEMRRRLGDKSGSEVVVPVEVVVVCGSGKHSSVRGVSPVKLMVREMIIRTGSPMRIDRKNTGCFIAKGKTVREWLCGTRQLVQIK